MLIFAAGMLCSVPAAYDRIADHGAIGAPMSDRRVAQSR